MEDEGRVPGSSAFGILLRRYRLAAGLSQEALAERARMSADGISALERGYRRTPQRETLALLAGALALNGQQRGEFEATATRSGMVRRATTVSVGPWADSITATFPLALTSFVGREAVLNEIAALVREHRMVTLTGAGGVGKTQTALHVSIELSDSAVCFIGLAPLSDPSLIVVAIASALGVQEVPNRPLLDTLRAYLKDKELLLILDNCEHVITQAAIIADTLLAGCPRARILATSREPLRAAGEYSYRLPSLNVPSPEIARGLCVADALVYGAISLFADRAQAADDRFMLTDENAPIVAQVCRRLDGIPLAIELAAARVSLLSIKGIVERLDDRFRFLTGGERTALPRQQTMRAAIDWSHDLLDERERSLFRRLGIFANGFAIEGAVAVVGKDLDKLDVFDVLASLVNKSLVLAEPQADAMRYRLLESTRAYAAEKLADAGERDLVAERHLRYLRDRFAELREERERTARHSDFDTALQVELEDVRWALDGALARMEVANGADLLANISWSWLFVGLEAEGITRCDTYLEALSADESRLHALLSTTLSCLFDGSGLKVHALDRATQAVEHARVSGDDAVLAAALHMYAYIATFLHRFDDTERALAEAEAIPGTSANFRLMLRHTRALLYDHRGDIETAARMHEQLRKEHRSLGNVRAELVAAGNVAELAHECGQTQRAIAIVRETLPAARSCSDKSLLTMALNNLAGYLVSMEDVPGAIAAARESIGINATREPDHAQVEIAIAHLALAVALHGDHARAAALEGYADAAFGRHGFKREFEFTETTTHDRLTALLREALAPGELARLVAEGAALTPEAAIALALKQHEAR